METKKFQIRMTDSKGSGSFLYFEATDDTAREIACQTANANLQKQRENYQYTISSYFKAFKPIKTVRVVEYDGTTNKTKRGGLKFKLSLMFIKMKFQNGTDSYNDWYEAES